MNKIKLSSLANNKNKGKCEELSNNNVEFNNNLTKNVEIKKETHELRPNEAQQIKEPEPSYYAVIPANVRYDTRLSPLAKLLYGEITCLCQKEGFCWATNAYFAKLYQKSTRWISNVTNLLAKCGYISIELKYKKETKEIEARYISLKDISRKSVTENFHTPMEENFHTPMEENFQENNTSINNINIKKVSKKERQLESDKTSIGGAKNNSISISEKNKNKNKNTNSNSISQKQTKAKKTKPKPISFDEIIDAYTENEDLRKELKEHLKTRKQKKAALTNRALELSLKELDRIADSDEEKLRIVQKSIVNGWIGFFELNEKDKDKLNNRSSYNLNEYEKTMDTFENKSGDDDVILTKKEREEEFRKDLLFEGYKEIAPGVFQSDFYQNIEFLNEESRIAYEKDGGNSP